MMIVTISMPKLASRGKQETIKVSMTNEHTMYTGITSFGYCAFQ